MIGSRAFTALMVGWLLTNAVQAEPRPGDIAGVYPSAGPGDRNVYRGLTFIFRSYLLRDGFDFLSKRAFCPSRLWGWRRCRACTPRCHPELTMSATARTAHATPVTCHPLRRSPSTIRARVTVLAGYSDDRVTATLSGP